MVKKTSMAGEGFAFLLLDLEVCFSECEEVLVWVLWLNMLSELMKSGSIVHEVETQSN